MSVIPFGFKSIEIKELNQIVHRPYVQVELKSSRGEWIPFSALVDSGADFVLLPKSACDAAGYRWQEGTEFELKGISRKTECAIKARRQEVSIRIGHAEFPAPVAFAEIEEVPILLGREGVFTRFDVYFKERSKAGEFRS